MERIVPHLWFDTEAKEAADFYVSLFPDSKVEGVTTLHDTPAGDADIVSFKLAGKSFMATNAGPAFTFNPSISFILNFDPSKDKNARENMSRIWEKLANDGDILMPLQKYDFSEFYGWVQDKYGLSWQLILSDPEGEERPFIMSSLLFTGDVYGKAEDTMNYYLSIFSEQDDAQTKKGALFRYEEGQDPDDAEAVMFADFMVLGQWFSAMDSARQHGFAFNEAVSFMVY
ncbi:MAG: VOC family protein, partial [Candidatus Dojkabacteria bacterium]|nr:VOC family protein [Candidatus Dojkabacteria bacterium]